jgi:hypothetical protein
MRRGRRKRRGRRGKFMQYQKLLPVSILTVLGRGTGYSEGKEASIWAVESRILTTYDREVNKKLTGFKYKS